MLLEWSLIDCTVLRNGGWKCLPFVSIDCIFSLCIFVVMASRCSVPPLRPSSAPPASPVWCLISLTYFSSCSLSEEPDWCNCLHTCSSSCSNQQEEALEGGVAYKSSSLCSGRCFVTGCLMLPVFRWVSELLVCRLPGFCCIFVAPA